MNLNQIRMLAALTAAFFLAACGPQAGSQVAVIDLSEVARATGEDENIRQRAEDGRTELTNQLQSLAQTLDVQIATEREKIGVAPNEQDAERLQQMTAQARQQIAQAQQSAQQQAAQMETTLVFEFRDALVPLAEKIALSRGLKMVLSNDAYIFWADETINITDEVITAWQAQQGPDETADAPAAMAEPEAAVEEAIAEIAADLAEASDAATEAATEAAPEAETAE